MTRPNPASLFASALCIGMFGFAFVAAPHACAWGLDAYFDCGIAVVIALMAIPFVLQRARSIGKRALLSLGMGTLGTVIWFAGLFFANVQFICRLF